MIEYNFTIGIMLLLLNSLILLVLIFGIGFRINSLDNSSHIKDFDINFMVLLASVVFLFSNSFAFYTGYKHYIINGGITSQDIIVARFADRTGMLVVSILLIFIGKGVSKNIIEDENK